MIRALTSASNLYRRALCPGSARMETGLSEPEQENEWSTEGTLLHACFMAPDAPERATLTLDQRETVEHAERLAEEFFANVRVAFGIPEDCLHADEKEYEFWFDGAFPGHCDLRRTWVFEEKPFAAIVDAKFGYVPVEHALDNLQLASYAAMSWMEERIDLAIAVAIIQPRAFGPRLTQAIYTADHIPDAIKEIRDVYDNSLRPDAPLIAGEKQCFHCRAKAGCAEFKSLALSPVSSLPSTKKEACLAIPDMPNEALESLMLGRKMYGWIDDALVREVSRRTESGLMQGWKMRSNGDVITVTHPTAFFRAFMAYFSGNEKVTASAFDDCRKFNIGAGVALVMEALGITKDRAREILDDIMAPFVTRTPKEKSPVRDNKKLES